MINAFSKLFRGSLLSTKFSQLNTKIKYNNQSIAIFHRLEIDSISDKWHVDFSYNSTQLTLNQQKKVRPNSFGNLFSIKLVQKSQRFVKGRPQYKIDFHSNQIQQLANWSPKRGKFQIVRTNQFKQEVLTVDEVIKTQPDPVTKEFLVPIKKEAFPIKLYRFNFYNNKIEGQKTKEFYLNSAYFKLFQQTLKSSFNGLSFNQNKEEYEIWKLERQIVMKEMIINREQDK